ncbi:MAG: hypothetical protein J6P79_08070 [Pseudobutyrivibrio sp.]|nr:hypothetical protein [Pseudobutyrivibrio sp.]
MDCRGLFIYVLSLAFQIAGAVLLILKYWGNTRQRIINEYFPGTGIASNDGDDNALLDVFRVRECVIEIYSSRVAFIYIAIGYALSVFGEKGDVASVIVLLMVFVASEVLIGVECMLARVVAKVLYKDDIIISYADLLEYIDRTASTKDVDELINKTFSE